jgi:hypothetical protein
MIREPGGAVIICSQPDQFAVGVGLSGPVPRIHNGKNGSENLKMMSTRQQVTAAGTAVGVIAR